MGLRVDEITGDGEQGASFEVIAERLIVIPGNRGDIGGDRDGVLPAEDGGGIVRPGYRLVCRERAAEGEDGSVREGDARGRADTVGGEAEITARGGDATRERVRRGRIQDPSAAVRLLQI